eukprot:scaffold85703_cov47-Attheya_sp.AAC.3
MLRETINAFEVLVESRSDTHIKVLLIERSASFPPLLTSYIGICTLVPEILSNCPSTKNPSASTNIQKDTALNDNVSNDSFAEIKDFYAEINASNADIKAQVAQLATLITLVSPKSTRASSTLIDDNSDDIEAKTEATDILIADKVKERHSLCQHAEKYPRVE